MSYALLAHLTGNPGLLGPTEETVADPCDKKPHTE